jgi:class 3 adenylate cyclase
MGIHVGEAIERDNTYFGPTLNRAARLMKDRRRIGGRSRAPNADMARPATVAW